MISAVRTRSAGSRLGRIQRLVFSCLCGILLSTSLSCSRDLQLFGQMRAEDWVTDINFLTKQLPRRHPELYAELQETVFLDSLEGLAARAGTLSDQEVAFALASILALARDGHTELPLPELYRGHHFPIGLQIFGGDVYALAVDSRYSRALGARLTAINGVPIDSVMRRITPTISADNASQIQYALPVYLIVPEILLAAGTINDMAAAEFSFNLDGSDFSVQVSSEWNETVVSLLQWPGPVALGLGDHGWVSRPSADRAPLFLQRPRVFYWYTELPETDLLYVKISLVVNQRGDASPVRTFCEEVLQELRGANKRGAVFDFRNNPGGNFRLLQPCINGIASNSRINRHDRLFVLTNHATSSAAMTATALFNQQTEATVIGGVPRSRPNFSYDADAFVLPRSGITVEYTREVRQLFPELAGVRELVPEHVIVPDKDAYMQGRDPVLEAVIELVRGGT